MMNMSIRQEIQRQIVEIESRMSQDKGDVAELKKLLDRLRMQDFEEDIREVDSRQFLRD
jgi:predicted lipid-binding transport protein (Tim44 family)